MRGHYWVSDYASFGAAGMICRRCGARLPAGKPGKEGEER